MQTSTIRLILGDQLNSRHSWFHRIDNTILYVLFESRTEATYAPHHIQKVAGIFSAMRQFASKLESEGHRVHYQKITEDKEFDIMLNLVSLSSRFDCHQFEIIRPEEIRLLNSLLTLREKNRDLTIVDSEHFLSEPEEFQKHFQGKKSYLMESFYRRLRKKYGILMNGSEPIGGQWNFDAQNRKKLPKNHAVSPLFVTYTDVSEVLADIQNANIPTIGEIGNPAQFIWPTTTVQAEEIFEHWLTYSLPYFGDYQDAMSEQSWAMYHSRISFALNLKMISPLWVCQRVEQAYHEHQLPLNAVEGFIRQVLGWREFMRGVYWTRMPEFGTENYFDHTASLPSWFWDGETKMNCQQKAIKQSLKYSYAHHIQRLMVTGNFALLAGIHPDEVDQWYLGIYIDAFEWVEITNTRGMSQFADGGWIATKPYTASANYINKMSDYCVNCTYKAKTRTEENSCPLNALYWDFHMRHEEKLAKNPRIGMVYRNLNKMSVDEKSAIRSRASWIKNNLDRL